MSLDLSKVAGQIAGMVAKLKDGRAARRERVEQALSVLRTADFESLKKKVAASRTTWLVAGLVEGISQKYGMPPVPADFTVLASDGSHIDVDRHQAVRCFLINIGTVLLHYGDSPAAELNSYPHLYSGDEELVIRAEGDREKEQAIEGPILGIKRSVEECAYLVKMGAGLSEGSSCLALLDGTLILWGLSGNAYPDFVKETLLEKGMLLYLEEMRKLNQTRKLAVASYISFPRSNDVINTLQVSLCPHEIVDTDRYCNDCRSRECERLSGIQDSDLFMTLLQPGERSALFSNTSSIVESHYGSHRVYFFYLRVEDEVARVEVPEWVAANRDLLSLTHALTIDQCRRGQGYPVALSEAHEQAVVTGTDRENFWQIVEASLIEKHMPSSGSAKSLSKRTRWL